MPATSALLAVLLALGAWTLWGMWLDGYHPLFHPFALPGARGLPGAGWFNTLVFVLPGGLMAILADDLRRRLSEPPSWRLRIGCALALLAAVGWIAQGLWPLEWQRLDAGNSRWHVLAWMLWWVAAASAALWMALAASTLRVCGLVLMAVLVLPWILPAGSTMTILAQPVAVLVWGIWMWIVMQRLTIPSTTHSH